MAIDEDKELLRSFVVDLFEWLELCHRSQGDQSRAGWPIIHPIQRMQLDARSAWEQFSAEQAGDELSQAITELSELAMRRSGLFGAQLSYKLKVLAHRAERAVSGTSRDRARFAEFLEILLDSLLELLGAGTAIKELVGALKAQLR